ncbi:hypothetical protein [Catenovulum maritimum]|uniref:hypothetical protein n=1 Tax=Catenovulum maritimum TaxID=1513271 RepID=UPI000661492B|nr:hypothetical protein [Catenovulum maritimum]
MGVLTWPKKLLLFSSFFTSYCVSADILVVTHKDSKLELTRQQIKHLYLGAKIADGETIVKPISLPSGDMTRTIFHTRIVGLSESRIQSYWAQMRFSGQRKPPVELSDMQQIKLLVTEKKGYIAYLPSGSLNQTAYKVLYKVSLK